MYAASSAGGSRPSRASVQSGRSVKGAQEESQMTLKEVICHSQHVTAEGSPEFCRGELKRRMSALVKCKQV